MSSFKLTYWHRRVRSPWLFGLGLSAALLPNTLALAAEAPNSQSEQPASIRLSKTKVIGQAPSYQGETQVKRDLIEGMPAGNGDITSLLKIHPNVQFDNGQLSSKNPGEIDPANISINGARYWQNQFMVDGMNMNNDIDPGASGGPNSLPGRSQGLAIDTDLLDSITVLDSNVPASYGGFNGGVVEANTRKPTQQLSGKVSTQMTRSSWTRYHIDDQDPDLDAFEAAFGNSNQPEFSKLTTRASLEGHITENFGLLGSFSRKESTIPTRSWGLSHTSDLANSKQDQKRQIDNYFLKANWQINADWDMDISLTHAPEINRGFGPNSKDSQYELKQGGDSVNTRLRWNAPWAQVEQTLAWSSLESSRDSETDYMAQWRSSTDKNWSSTTYANQGTFGQVEQTQKSLSYKLVADWNSFDTFGITHNWQTGFELNQQEVNYDRSTPYYYYGGMKNLAGASCNGDPWCASGTTTNGWNGQYASAMSVTAGKVGFSTNSKAFFVQNELQYKRLSVRPGVRIDADDYMDKTTVSPRLAANLDVFGDQQTNLSAGANRYYGRNLFAYRLYENVAGLTRNYDRDAPGAAWQYDSQGINNSKFNQLDIPYNDEFTLALSHIQWDTEFALKYVNRKGRDLISRAWGSHIGQPSADTTLLTSNYYTYYNGGESESDTYSLTITPLNSFELAGTQSHMQLVLDWTDVVSSGLSDYTSNIGLIYVDDPIIQYDGSFMRSSERPADNYNRPWTLRLNTSTEISALNLTWNNFFRYRDGYTRMAATGKRVSYQGEQVRVWEETHYSGALTWDTRLAWELPLGQSQAAFVNLDVTNVLDEVIVNNANSDAIPTYEVGRQFMLEVGYRF